MSINSVNTNVGAMIALQSLNETNSDLAATKSGFRPASASPTPPTTVRRMPWHSRCVPPSVR